MKKTNHKTLVQILLSVLCLVTLQTRQLVLMSHYSMLFPIPCTRHYYNIQNVNIYQAATLGSGMLQPHNENYQRQSTTAPPPPKKKTKQNKTKTKTNKKNKRKKERKKGNMFKATHICSDIVMPMSFL